MELRIYNNKFNYNMQTVAEVNFINRLCLRIEF